ncbi:MAG: ABC transporter ATP-binding protein [Mycobacteriales bacterium]
MARLELDGLTHARPDGTPVVDRVTLDVADGELVTLLGPSGSGKSTLLRALLGLADITAGELRLAGERANDWAPAERDLAMVHQDYAPYPHLSVRDNLAFPLRMLGAPEGVVHRRVQEVARTLELTVHLDRGPSQLSGGQRQRVAIGRALVRRPNAFLLDEPLSQADPGMRGRLRGRLLDLQRETATSTLYATEDQAEALTIGDRVAVLRRGRLEQVGRPQEVYERPATLGVAVTVGSSPPAVLPATVDGAVLHLPMVDVPVDPATAGRLAGRDRVVAAIRPEHVEEAARVDPDRAAHGVRFTLPVAGTEWTGSELLVRLRHPGGPAAGGSIGQLDRPPPGELVARLDPASAARDRRVLTVWVDTRRILLFDPETGAALS